MCLGLSLRTMVREVAVRGSAQSHLVQSRGISTHLPVCGGKDGRRNVPEVGSVVPARPRAPASLFLDLSF